MAWRVAWQLVILLAYTGKLQLRFNKISELIHNSTNHRNCEAARVTVHFQEIIDKARLHVCACMIQLGLWER